MVTFIICFLLLPAFPFITSTQITNNRIQDQPFYAKIETGETDAKLKVTGKFINNSNSSILIEYEMETNKISRSGNSLSTQSGKYTAEPKSEQVLAKVGLNFDKETRYEIILKVFKDEELISADSLNYIPENQ